MYIGPWQEYNLGKAAVAQNQADLKENLERVLLSSLDPISAARAIEAMNPVLDSIPTKTKALNSSRSDYSNQSKPSYHISQLMRKSTDPDKTLKLPAINIDTPNDRSRSGAKSGPGSCRTSVSEPIYNSKQSVGHQTPKPNKSNRKGNIPPTAKSMQQQQQQSVSTPKSDTGQPPYNALGAVNLLRLERSTRSKNPDFTKFWDWGKGGDGTRKSDQEEGKSIRRKSKTELKTEEKLAALKQMQNIYKLNSTTTTAVLTAITTEESHQNSNQGKILQQQYDSSRGYLRSPIRLDPIHEREIRTPIVKDKELDAQDIDLVAKYFRGQNRSLSTPNETSSHNGSPRGGRASSNKLSLVAPTLSPIAFTENNSYTYRKAEKSPYRYDRDALTSPGAMENLLKWSLELDESGIDNLY